MSAARVLPWAAAALLGSWAFLSGAALGTFLWPMFPISIALLAIGFTAQLASVPLKAVHCTELERSRQTAGPSAVAHGLKLTVTPYDDLKVLAKMLLETPSSDDVLVIGHSDTIPGLLAALGAKEKVEIGPDDYDDLFIVAPSTAGVTRVHRLHYTK